ncbi:ATP-dependent 6-phosphofructokinase [Candidatus Haliotispira prima]|uniref:ATP-dependent 6-phosphofructokinase n=1 Tax=Candidatus Haliotispira prima TaxID=3034016 RepID=A0ABY8MI33_9SPIO|nr:ATP-dependent 6-phosphofructokinase [Candidatus Haliotispira prima]
MREKKTESLLVEDLGERSIPSPMNYAYGETSDALDKINGVKFTRDPSRTRVPVANRFHCLGEEQPIIVEREHSMELAGPRREIFFDPHETSAAIVTCGGLCPGLNDIIHSIVDTLWDCYKVHNIIGIRNGYPGFKPDVPTIQLNPNVVKTIHKIGGSFLGSARGGGKDITQIAARIEQLRINILFVIGGDGTLKGARDLSDYLKAQGRKIAVVGVPKTIDNDILFVHKTFGFDTAVSLATQAVESATVEATSAPNGIGLVKLMGRDSGFIAAHTAIASQDADFVLIPEVPFDLDGANGLLMHLKRHLRKAGHAVIVVAEGAGQEFFTENSQAKDKGGNLRYKDIGTFLRDRINTFFQQEEIDINLKYIDPSYMIRAARPIATDAFYCARMGTYAAHAAMAGKTSVLISYWNSTFVHIPISAAVTARKTISHGSTLWRHVIEATAQPVSMKND